MNLNFKQSRSHARFFFLSFYLSTVFSQVNASELNYWPKVKEINSYVNANFFVSDDLSLWSIDDYWSTPTEFKQKGGGDCEDFAIAKYFYLIDSGVPKSLLALSYVTLNKDQPHMVMLFYSKTENAWFVLDSVEEEVLPTTKRTDLDFIYSFNEKDVWVHTDSVKGRTVASAKTIGKWQDLLKRIYD